MLEVPRKIQLIRSIVSSRKKNGPFISSFSMPKFYHVIGVNISCYIVWSSGRSGVGVPFRIDGVHSSKLLGLCGQS